MDRVIDISGYGCKVRSDTGRLVVETAEGERTFVPFRVVADRAVVSWLATHPNVYEMSRECRRALVGGVLSSNWKTSAGRVPFFAALSRMAVSLRECLCTNTVDLEIPELIEKEAA